MILEVESVCWKYVFVGFNIRVSTKRLIRGPFRLMPNTNVEMGAGASIDNLAHAIAAGEVTICITLLGHYS
jgi:hypothetical protein